MSEFSKDSVDRDETPIRLTQTVKKGGCAAKLPAGELKEVLGGLKLQRRPEMVLGAETLDDAALWDLGDGRLLVQTLDFFTPIVDDPEDFGAIAAVNALSDVYAMGGQPATALSILAFPASTLPLTLLDPLMRGAVAKIHEAQACLVGGHTIDDETLKFGLSVTGFVDKNKQWTNAGARVGDVLILTKGLGTGTITTALKINEAEQSWIAAAIESMKTLNRAPDLLEGFSIQGATDITGFGLAGHALQMAQASGVRFELNAWKLPVLLGARECLRNEMLNRAHRTNLSYVTAETDFEAASEEDQWLSVDPQTSGGLLLSVPEQDADRVLLKLRSRFPLASIIGRVLPKEAGHKTLTLRSEGKV
jgi:selenide,water dikinase